MEKKSKSIQATLTQAFTQQNISVQLVANKEQALEAVRLLVKQWETVAFAGSQTIVEIGAREFFLNHGKEFKIIDPYEGGISSLEATERRRQALLADVLLTSSNAITLDGHLVNMDNQGNRVAGLSFGPKKVVVVVGKNKIVKNDAEARRRIATIAAPLNSKRLKKGNPCEESGKCESCGLDSRICRIYSVINGQAFKDRMYLIVVDEDLGF